MSSDAAARPVDAVTIDDVRAAAARLAGIALRTPLLRCPALDALTGGTVLLKPECLQRTGSFKIRGAYNLMSQLDAEAQRAGVVAFSSGNHAQGVAEAGRLLGIHAAIVMPEDAPPAKIANTRRLGGETILYDRYTGDREQIARALASERGACLVPSYDHRDIIAGQGTVGLEIAQDLHDAPPDQMLAACSGGGLIAGSALAMSSLAPACRIYAVEPADFDDTARSLAAGRRVAIEVRERRSICDALQAATPGKYTFAINGRLLAGALAVTDGEVRKAMRFALRELKLVVEPGGATPLAAVLAGHIDCRDQRTVLILSGGNVDVRQYADIQAEADS